MQTGQGQFARYEGMGQYEARIQKSLKFRIALAQMVYPNRRVDQNHLGSDWRRLGMLASDGSVPASNASRLALSR
jgi:hypothetical protein